MRQAKHSEGKNGKINLNFSICFSTNEMPYMFFLLCANGKLQSSDVLEGKSGGKSCSIAMQFPGTLSVSKSAACFITEQFQCLPPLMQFKSMVRALIFIISALSCLAVGFTRNTLYTFSTVSLDGLKAKQTKGSKLRILELRYERGVLLAPRTRKCQFPFYSRL